MRILCAVLALAVSLAIAGNLSAEEKKKGSCCDPSAQENKKGSCCGRPAIDGERVFKGLDYTATGGNHSAKGKKRGSCCGRPAAGGMRMFKGLNLSDEQKAKFEELKKEYQPKRKALGEKMRDILTDEQKKARAEAHKAAKEAGKKGKEIRAAVKDAVKLTDEQKAKFAELRKEMQALGKEMREKRMEILTPEQKEILKKKFEQRKKHKGHKAHKGHEGHEGHKSEEK